MEGARRVLTPGAPPDCLACKTFFFDRETGPVRPRFKGEEVHELQCRNCEWTLVEPGTFSWSEKSRMLFQRWRLWRKFGARGPDNLRDMVLFAGLDQIQMEVLEKCQTHKLIW